MRRDHFCTSLALLLWCGPAWTQSEIMPSGPNRVVRLLTSDLAVLEDEENRTDLRCQVAPLEPTLGFDLRFHSGYQVTLPLSELAGGGTELRVLLRVTPMDEPGNLRYLVDRRSVPPIEEDAKGTASLPGWFDLGPGRYRVDWLMRDRGERVCSAHWTVEARLEGKQRELPLTMAAHTVAQRPRDLFSEQAPVARASEERPLHVKLLVNFSPGDSSESTLKSWDVEAIVNILRGIAREPRIGVFSVVAFNMQQEQVIFRQQSAPRIDFPALGEAVNAVELGTVDYRRLLDPHSDVNFLTTLLGEQLGPEQPDLDAIIIVGPKLMLNRRLPHEALKQAGQASCPIFYLNYNSDPRRHPWRDVIAAALRIYRGLEYSITLPRELGGALSDMMFRLAGKR